MTDTPILLLGAGGHCRACIDVIEQADGFAVAGLVDRDPALRGASVLGYTVLGTDDELPLLHAAFPSAVIAVGQIDSAAPRVALYGRLKELGFALPVIVSPLAYVSPHAAVAEGTMVMHHAVINAGARVGANCIVNTRALVEHDAHVGAHTHVATGAVINGGASIGERSFVGSGAVVVHGVRIPDDRFLPAAHLIRSLRDTRTMAHARPSTRSEARSLLP